MKEGDVIIGDFGNVDKPYITHYRNDENPQPFIEINKNRYSKGCLGVPRFKPKRLATPQEQAQLITCIKANKFIPLDKIKINQQFKTYI